MAGCSSSDPFIILQKGAAPRTRSGQNGPWSVGPPSRRHVWCHVGASRMHTCTCVGAPEVAARHQLRGRPSSISEDSDIQIQVFVRNLPLLLLLTFLTCLLTGERASVSSCLLLRYTHIYTCPSTLTDTRAYTDAAESCIRTSTRVLISSIIMDQSRRMLCCGGVSMSMSCSDVVTICGLFAVQCIYGLYMMFLSALLAAGVPSLFIIVVACAASSIVVLPFALALERYVRLMWVDACVSLYGSGTRTFGSSAPSSFK